MPRKAASKRVAATLKQQRKKVGEFVRKRRRELGLSQRDLVRTLGYKSAVSISDVEIGRTRVPFRRMFQYADALQIPRAEFVRYVVGELQGSPAGSTSAPKVGRVKTPHFSAAERQLVEDFRRLAPMARSRVRQQLKAALSGRGRRG